jgi:hypothetical protein
MEGHDKKALSGTLGNTAFAFTHHQIIRCVVTESFLSTYNFCKHYTILSSDQDQHLNMSAEDLIEANESRQSAKKEETKESSSPATAVPNNEPEDVTADNEEETSQAAAALANLSASEEEKGDDDDDDDADEDDEAPTDDGKSLSLLFQQL